MLAALVLAGIMGAPLGTAALLAGSGHPRRPPGENELMARAVTVYGRRVGNCAVMVRRARLRAVAPGLGLAPAR